MEGLELGSAFFRLGLNAAGLAQGLTGTGSAVAGAVGKVVPGIGKIGESFGKADEKIGGIIRSTERFSRGLRGVSPDLGHANEQVYRYQDSLKGLQEQMEITKIRIQERKQAEKENTAQIESSRQNIAKYSEQWALLDDQLKQNEIALSQMRSGAIPATTDQIKNQQVYVSKLSTELEQLERVQRRETRTLEVAEGRVQKLSLERQRAEHVLIQQQQSESRYSSLLEMAGDRVKALAEKIKERSERQKAAKAASVEAQQADQQHVGILARLFGGFHSTSNSIEKLGQEEVRIVAIQKNFNAALLKTSSVLRDIAVGSIGSFIGNTLANIVSGVQGFAATGLDAYKNYQLLTMSLTALSAREGVMTGQFKDLGAAQEWAKGQSKELVDWMSKLAIQSPFSVEDISGAFRLGNALGFTASETQNLIAKTVDWAAATGASGEQITSVTRALGQMHNTGHASLEDINQLTDAGLGARDILRNEFAPEIKKTGMTLEDMVSAGLIPADRAINAISRSIGTDFKDGAKNAGDSMEGLINSIGDLKNTALREFFTRTFEVVSPLISNIVSVLQDDSTIASIISFGNMIGDGIGKAVIWVSDVAFPAIMSAVKAFGPMLMDGFAYLVAIGQEAYDWGYNVGAQFAQGLADTVEAIMDVINSVADTIAYWLEPHSPPKALPEIDNWGKNTAQVYFDSFQLATPEKSVKHMKKKVQDGLKSTEPALKAMGQDAIKTYFEGWTQADFGTLDTIRNNISGVLQGLVDGGSMKEKDLIPTLLGAGDGVKRAIDDIRKTGSISQDTFGRIRSSVGKANAQVSDYIESMLRVEQANRAVERAQNELNAVTAKYDKQLDPLRKKLEALNGSTSNADRDAELKRLESMKQAYASNGLQRNAQKIQAEIDRINTEKQIEQLEKKQAIEETAAAKKVADKQKIADKEAMQLDMQRTLIDQQKEQNELIKRQIELLTKKDGVGGTSTADAEAKKALAEQKKTEQEEKARQKAEYNARLAAANSEEEKLRIMQEEQSQYKAGTKEYLDMQAKIDVQKKKVAKASEDAARAEVDHNLAMAEGDQKMQILQDRMAQLDPQSEEYAKRKEQLLKLTQEQDKAQQKLSDAEFESELAGKSKAEQLVMLKDRLGTLTEGTMEYEKTLKRVNSLQFGLDNKKEPKGRGGGNGRKKKADVELGGGSGGILDTFSKVDNVAKNVTKSVEGISGAFSGVQGRITEFQGKVKPFFDFLNQSGGALAFVFQKLLVSFVVALAIEKVIKPLGKFIWGLRQFLTWGNLAWVALAALGYAWKINFGGIRDIAYELWQSLQEPFRDIVAMVNRVKDAFTRGGFGEAIREFFSLIPELAGDIAHIGVLVFSAIKRWVTPFIHALVDVFNGVVEWVKNGGPGEVLNPISTTIGNLWQTVISKGFLSSAAISAGVLGLVGGFAMIFQSAIGGILISMQEKGKGLMHDIGNWFQKNIPIAFAWVASTLSVLAIMVGEAIVPTIVWVGKRILDISSWLLPMIPDLLSGLATALALLVTWLLGRGVPLVISGIADLLFYAIEKVAEILPKLALNIGMFIGSTMTKLAAVVIGAIGLWVAQIGLALMDGSFLSKLESMGKTLLDFVWSVVKGAGGLIMGFLLGLVSPIADVANRIMDAIGMGLDTGANEFIANFTGMFRAAMEEVTNFLGITTETTEQKVKVLTEKFSPATEAIGTFRQTIKDLIPYITALGVAILGYVAYQNAALIASVVRTATLMVSLMLPAWAQQAIVIVSEVIPATIAWITLNKGNLIPAIGGVILKLGQMAVAQLAAVGPWLLIAAAIGGVIYAFNKFTEKARSAADALLKTRKWWNDSTKALEEYAAASDEVKEKLADKAVALDEMRESIRSEIEVLGERMAAGLVSDEQYAKEMAAINAKKDALKAQTTEFNFLLQKEKDAAKQKEEQIRLEQEHKEKIAEVTREVGELSGEIKQAFSDMADTETSFINESEARKTEHLDRITQMTVERAQTDDAAQQKAIDERIDAENASYQQSERDAALSYAKQQADQRQHLGQMLLDYINAQEVLHPEAKARYEALSATIRKEYGIAEDISGKTFDALKADIDRYASGATDDLGAVQKSMDLTSDRATAMRKRMLELSDKYTAELALKYENGSITPEQYAEQLAKLPAKVQTEVKIEFDKSTRETPDDIRRENREIGRNIQLGIQDGVNAEAPNTTAAISGQNQNVINKTRKDYDINSPSGVYFGFGQNIMQGLINGYNSLSGTFEAGWTTMKDWLFGNANETNTGLNAIQTDQNDTLSGKWSNWKDDTMNIVSSGFDSVLKLFGVSKTDTIKSSEDQKTGITDQWNGLKTNISTTTDLITTIISDAWNNIRDTATQLWSEGADGIVGRIISGVMKLGDKFKELFMGQGEGTIQWYVKQAWESIKQTLINSWDDIGWVISDKINYICVIVRDSINQMIDMANQAIDALNTVPGVSISHIPRLYKGTQFAPGGMTIVGENGPEMVQLPRGSEVMTNSRTMSIFEDTARNVMRSMNEGVNNAMKSIEKAVDGATSAISNASQQQPNVGAQGPQTVITQNNNVKNERHDHWNLTVNTRATEGTVKTDFATMMSLAGV